MVARPALARITSLETEAAGLLGMTRLVTTLVSPQASNSRLQRLNDHDQSRSCYELAMRRAGMKSHDIAVAAAAAHPQTVPE
jgi:hypothetical protein